MTFPRYRPMSPLKTEQPLVSVIMFCRNRVGLIRRAVESILGQSYPHWELVVQDGASTDGTREAIESFQDPRIRLVSAPDKGPFDAMWRAYRRCQGEITGSCLSDEELLPNALAEGVQYFLCHPETAAIARDVFLIRPDGSVFSRYNSREFNFIDYASIEASLTLQTVLFRREALLQIGLMTRDWRIDCADFELFTLISRTFRMDSYPGAVGKYGQHHEGQLSTTPEIGFFSATGQLRFIDDYFRSDPSINRLGGFVRKSAAEAIHKLYLMKGATDYQLKLDEFLGSLPESEPEYSMAAAQQAIGAGKLYLAGKIIEKLSPQESDQAINIWKLSAELESILEPDQRVEFWIKLSELKVPGADEELLSIQLCQPGVDPAQILARQKKWARQQDQTLPNAALHPHVASSDRPKLAFHAADWTTQEVRHQILPLLQHLEPAPFEILAYLPPQSSPVIFPAHVRVEPVVDFSTAAFRDQVRKDQVEILIELSGLSPGHQWSALAGRCAPKQVAYLGHMATTGLRQVDFQLADEIVCPQVLQRWHTEKILHLPYCYTGFAIPCPQPASDVPQPRRLDERFTFGSLADRNLLNNSVFDCWARLLKITPNSRLVISNPSLTISDRRSQIWNFFRRYDIPRESLLLVPRLPGEISPYLTAQFDLYLDTFPHNDPSGLGCALSRGIPAISLAGNTMAGRLGASILHWSGLKTCITRQIEEYAVLAHNLAQRFPEVQEWKANLAQQVLANGLTDLPRFATNFSRTLSSITG